MSHMQNVECKNTNLCRNRECTKKGSSDHHFFLCTRGGVQRAQRNEKTQQQEMNTHTSLAMRETAILSMFAHLKEECRVLEEDSYVEDILTSHNDLEQLNNTTKTVEEVLKAGSFHLKPWVRSGQSGRHAEAPEHAGSSGQGFVLPNQMREGDNKAS